MDFIAGQRWVSDAESQMGLGTILSIDARSVTIHFLASGDTRTYARRSAPLTRVSFSPGDKIKCHEGWSMKVQSVQHHDGLITYLGENENGDSVSMEESLLDNFMQLSRPTDRLFNGQIDHAKLFDLRRTTLQHLSNLGRSDLTGLTSGRTQFITHQLYIAHEVANRYAPRVLLADEVGLGKTIEAGLIVNHQLLTERAKRVLIVVPESLVHQWLVEMIRKFNLYFSIFDEERLFALQTEAPHENPFHAEQLVICSLNILSENASFYEYSVKGEWDLLVVDEAHHLQWSATDPSIEYSVVETLAANTKGALLLTATPEQLGKESHFARLRLLDPDRFSDYSSFLEEEKSYEPIANAIETMLENEVIDSDLITRLKDQYHETDNDHLLNLLDKQNNESNLDIKRELVEHLLDRHGTGRILYRNTRHTIKGFPERKLNAYPLKAPDNYQPALGGGNKAKEGVHCATLQPELIFKALAEGQKSDWTLNDPRVGWLEKTLTKLRPEKVLVITASAETALDLSRYLKNRVGIIAAVFHESLSIIERDRAAAYFSDKEYGTQVLVCSEIGSEGRNFQFAHHLVLFDLPLNPNLLEQRIGRLDRIGQTQTINIHVPYIEGCAQEVLFRWYHQGLNAFEKTCPAGNNVFSHVQTSLLTQLNNGVFDDESIQSLIEATREYHDALTKTMHLGRDKLLEYNSCKPGVSENLKQRVTEQELNSGLKDYMVSLFDCFGIDFEVHSEKAFVIKPGDHMLSPVPGLLEEGLTITFDRQTALTYEDMQFFTWQHPLVVTLMDMVATSEIGNTTVSVVKTGKTKPGTIFLECIFLVQATSKTNLQTQRFLPPKTIRILVDEKGNDDNQLTPELIRSTRVIIDKKISKKVIQAKQKDIKTLVSICEKKALDELTESLTIAEADASKMLNSEMDRLKALIQVNPNVRQEEIAFLEGQLSELNQLIQSTTPKLDSIGVLIGT